MADWSPGPVERSGGDRGGSTDTMVGWLRRARDADFGRWRRWAGRGAAVTTWRPLPLSGAADTAPDADSPARCAWCSRRWATRLSSDTTRRMGGAGGGGGVVIMAATAAAVAASVTALLVVLVVVVTAAAEAALLLLLLYAVVTLPASVRRKWREGW